MDVDRMGTWTGWGLGQDGDLDRMGTCTGWGLGINVV